MIIRSDKRHGAVFDVLIEFKFVSLGTAGVTGGEAKKMSVDALYKLPCIKEQLKDDVKQVKEYSRTLEHKYKKLRLKRFVVVSLGFDRLCFEVVT